MDIRELSRLPALPPHLDPNIPTLFISECCLIYMEQDSATELLRWITRVFGKGSVAVILYEPIGGHDAFGKVMVKNLAVNSSSTTRLIFSGKGHQLKNPFRLSDVAKGNASSQRLWIYVRAGRY
jgi:O-methyltransferase involved in polyketide biosynthesis